MRASLRRSRTPSDYDFFFDDGDAQALAFLHVPWSIECAGGDEGTDAGDSQRTHADEPATQAAKNSEYESPGGRAGPRLRTRLVGHVLRHLLIG